MYRTFFPDTQGGLEEVIRQISYGTKKYGVISQVFTVSPYVNSYEKILYEGLEVHRVPRFTDIASSSIPRSGLSIFKSLVAEADVVHFHVPWPVGDILYFSISRNKKTIVTYHSDIVRQKFLGFLYTPLMYCFLYSVDSIIATSPNYLSSSKALQRFRSKVDVVPIGIDSDSYKKINIENYNKWKSTFGNEFFFFVGVLRYYKGLDVLIKSSKINGLPVIIAGDGPEGESLRDLVEELNADNVTFLGKISDTDKMSLLKLCKAFVLPSFLRSEAFGVCLLEAQMLKKPLITSDIGSGMSYVNLHNITGLVVEPNNPNSLSDAMLSLSQKKGLAEKLGSNGYLRFKKLFTGERMSKLYAEKYFEIVNK